MFGVEIDCMGDGGNSQDQVIERVYFAGRSESRHVSVLNRDRCMNLVDAKYSTTLKICENATGPKGHTLGGNMPSEWAEDIKIRDPAIQ